MKLKRNLLLIFFILAGIVLGGMLANLCANIPFLSWLAYSSSIGFNADSPFVPVSYTHLCGGGRSSTCWWRPPTLRPADIFRCRDA